MWVRCTLKIAGGLPVFASYYALLCIIMHLLFLSPDWLFCLMIISLILIHSVFYLFSVSL